MKRRSGLSLFLLASVGLGLSAGCAVPQPRGEGQYMRVSEPRVGGVYHLSLPKDYVAREGRHPDYPRVKRWPLVMTFHGMKPYDNAIPQEREWEHQADIYGFIICAPELGTNDSFMEYPLTKEHGYVLKDRDRVLSIMDHVFATTSADPARVLSTSWSCGGYFAHYFPNRYPDRFSCIATRLSNFSAPLMDERTVPLYRERVAVGVFIGDGDLPACKSESKEAVAWYMARNFNVVRGRMIDSMGHRRIPQTAAAFFAEHHGIKPLYPVQAAQTLAEVQMSEYYPEQTLIAKMSPPPDLGPTLASAPSAPAAKPPQTRITSKPPIDYVSTTAGRNYPFDTPPNYQLQPESNAKGEPAGTGSSAPSAAGATRVAAAPSGGANWLEPVGKIAPPPFRPAPPSPSTSREREKDNDVAATPGVSDEPVRRPRSTARFSPSEAGPKDYDLWRHASHNGPAEALAAPRSASAARGDGPPADSNPARLAAAPARRSPKRVNIRLTGPVVGTAPHYIQYGVDLPTHLLDGADFLWKDNGVWMGDQPSGAKILESPGPHKITVLLVTRDNAEYRGMATVHVLAGGPLTANLSDAP